MRFAHDPLLVLLSLVVAIQASYVGLSLARRVPQAFALNRRLLIAGSALSLAVGIWAMHFVGMLAAKSPIMIDYFVLPTLVSFLVCVLVTGIAVYLASLRGRRMLVIAATVMGLGIVSMHYIGMLAVHASAHMEHAPAFVAMSVAIAIAASALALWLAFRADNRPPLLLCAAVLGCAISGMHYTAMAGVTLHAMADADPLAAQAISREFLAVVVSIVAFAVSGVFMLALLPGDDGAAPDMVKWGAATAPALPVATGFAFSPLAAGAPRPSVPVTSSVADPATATAVSSNGAEASLPIETHGSSHKIGFDEIVCVHANAHYTYVFDGRNDLFCPLSISDITGRLPQDRFFRVHRSYIVNLDHVIRVRKAGDNGIAELDAPVRRTVPVSRARIQPLRAEMAGRRSERLASDHRALGQQA